MATAYGKAAKGTGPEIPEVEDGYYVAQVKDVVDSESSFNGESHPQYMVRFELTDLPKAGGYVELAGWIRIPDGVINDGILNENSKLYEFIKALGYEDENLEIDPSEWFGQQCRVHVENREITAGPNKGQVRPRITAYKRVKGSGPAQAAAAAARTAPKAAPRRSAQVQGDDDF